MTKDIQGFSLLEVILSLFIVGLIIRYSFPMIDTNIKVYNENEERNIKNEMYNNIIETIKINNKKNVSLDIYDINIKDIIMDFNIKDKCTKILEINHYGRNYQVKIEKSNKTEKIWKVNLEIICGEEEFDGRKGVDFLLEIR